MIDPEICTRCNPCEDTCPLKAISHDSRNYVVDVSVCNACNACISPCPTGAIDNWRDVPADRAYRLAEPVTWDDPGHRQLANASIHAEFGRRRGAPSVHEPILGRLRPMTFREAIDRFGRSLSDQAIMRGERARLKL